MQIDPQKLFESPAFWTALFKGAATAVQEGSPNYTIGHHVAAAISSILGGPVISTPTAHDAKPAGQAIADGARAAAAGVATAVDAARK